jgi:hypothetical protein
VYAGSSASGSPVFIASAPITSGTWQTTTSPLADGTHTVQVEHSDSLGHVTLSVPVSFSVDAAAPAVSLTTPADGAVLATATPTLGGVAGTAAGDASIVSVDVYSGSSASGTPVQTLAVPVSGGTWSAATAALADGTYTARAQQLDSAGNSGLSGTRTFTVDTAAPSVAITQPGAGSTETQASVPVSGTASTAAGDAPDVTVRVYSGGSASGTPVFTGTAAISSGDWQRTTHALADGTYTTQAEHSDSAGNVTLSDAVTFTVNTGLPPDTTAPSVTVSRPLPLETIGGTIPLQGTAGDEGTDSATVTVKIYGDPNLAPVRTVTATRTGTAWSTSTTALPNGTYTVKAEQSDEAGNTGVSPGVVFKAGNSYQQEVLADNPRGYWRLGETAGTLAADFGSGHNTGTYTGGALLGQAGPLVGDPDKAVRFDGVNDLVDFGDPADGSLDLGTGNFAVEFWLKTSSNSQNYSVIGKQTSGASWNILTTTGAAGSSTLGKLRATFSDGSTTRQLYSPVRVDDNNWHHVVVSFVRATGMEMYIDGARTSQNAPLTGSLSNSTPMQVGKVTGYAFFNGTIDDVALYPTALTQARVSAHLAAAQGPDVAPPAPTITGPASPTGDPRPTFTGRSGTQVGDSSQLTVKLYEGPTAGGSAIQTLNATTTENGVWSVNASSSLADGTYTAVVSQSDSGGNVGTASRTFTLSAPTAPPDYRAAIAASGPRGYWRLGEGSGTATGDEIGSNNAGALLNGASFAATGAIVGDADRAITFDGVDDEVNFGDPSNGSLDLGANDVTIEGWVKTTSTAFQGLLSKQGASGASWQLVIANSGGWAGSVRASFSNGSVTRQLYTDQRVDDGNWHYIAVTYRRNSRIDVWVDGYRNMLPFTLPGSLDNSGQLRLGRVTGYPAFSGSMDDFAVYDRALSASEIAAHYAEGTRGETAMPTPTLTAPANASSTTDSTPRFAGVAGTARGDLATVSVEIYSGSTVTGSPLRTAQVIAGADGKWTLEDGTALSPGTYTARALQSDTAGNTGNSAAVTFTVGAPPAEGSDPALIAAGDIASCGSLMGDEHTAELLGQLTGEIQTIGDNAYEQGSTSDFTCFNASWGPYKSRIHPSLGDHEYDLGTADPYFTYFGAASGGDPTKGYYSYDVGNWHIVVTNPNCGLLMGGCDAGGAQEQWVRQDLAANPRQCTIAVAGTPRFSSGEIHGNGPGYTDFWQAFYENGVDVVLTADDHVYERFAPQTPMGRSDPVNGIRSFTVGTGGYYMYGLGPTKPLSEASQTGTHGVLRLVLHAGSYDWRFYPVAGATYSDVGSADCH